MLKNISVNNTTIKVAIADSDKTRFKGLSGLKALGKLKGMLFIFPEPQKVRMVMRDMNFDLDFIFLDSKWNVIQLGSLSKSDKDGITAMKDISMILEVPKGIIDSTKLKVGDILKPEESLNIHRQGVEKFKHGGSFQQRGETIYEVIEDDIKINKDKMQILNDKSEVSANIDSGVRIFSRIHTKDLVKAANKKDTKELGKLIVDIFDIHDTQKPEFVKKNNGTK